MVGCPMAQGMNLRKPIFGHESSEGVMKPRGLASNNGTTSTRHTGFPTGGDESPSCLGAFA